MLTPEEKQSPQRKKGDEGEEHWAHLIMTLEEMSA